MTGQTVGDETKKTCASNDLLLDYYGAHSLRKGAITHMGALGVSDDDHRDRGNYAAGFHVTNQMYLGPLASSSLDKQDLKHQVSPGRRFV